MIKGIVLGVISMALLASSALAGPNCTCRYQGHNYRIGDVACILGHLKRCEMQLNNTSWQTIAQGCPQASVRKTPVPQDRPTPSPGQAKG